MEQCRQNKMSGNENCMEQPQKQGQQIGALEFVLTMERLPELNGTEGPSQIWKFFKSFSSATEGWPESRRVSALESKISGKAERAFDAAMELRLHTFPEICRKMEGILSEWDCTELRAFNELWEGVKRRPEEPLDEFVERLYGIVERAYPVLPPNFVNDFATKHLIPAMESPEISAGLELARRPGMSFDSFVALAVRAEAVQNATKSAVKEHRPEFKQKTTVAPQNFIMPKTNRVVCYNYNQMGHISRNCWFPSRPKHFNFSQKSPQHLNFVKKGADFRKNSEADKKPNDTYFRASALFILILRTNRKWTQCGWANRKKALCK
ncbi:hypothetical protein niasHT_002938 [Heterodera trifolii]|uniref:Gag protein n=1 Tax=Heterodera trifolii TaxID=157864 RepID=A0ABD2LRR0_9BILA